MLCVEEEKRISMVDVKNKVDELASRFLKWKYKLNYRNINLFMLFL